MDAYIAAPKMSEILLEEFMVPMNLSAYKLAQALHVPTSRVQDILHDRRKITPDTSLRLARYFGVSDRYFLDLQNDIDLLSAVGFPCCPPNARPEVKAIKGIRVLNTPGGQGAIREICDILLSY